MHPSLSVIKGGQLRRDDLFADAAHERLPSRAAAASQVAARGRGWAFLGTLAMAIVALSRVIRGDLIRVLSDGPRL